jgi:hypothetical protein
MRLRSIGLVLAFVLLAAACGNDSGTATETAEQRSGTADADGAPSDTPEGDGATEPGSAGSDTADADGATPADDDASPPDDDFGEIIGDPDFDEDNLPDGIAEMIDEIDDIVSLGDCVVSTVGIGIVAPEGWMCRVLDDPRPGFDGFSMFTEGTDLVISVSTPSPVGTCDIEGICSNVTPVDIPGFSDAVSYDIAGVAGGISGSHDIYAVDLLVDRGRVLTADDIAFVAELMATLGEV